jgi:3-hydroxymyristoyl/3-hydroxydecanoyl-(acyl carrier protein) dehydratase
MTLHGTALFTLDEILPILPHRPPFLFVDRVLTLDPHKSILAERTLRPEEPQFAGHFPGRPIMPGVLVAEALAQTSGLLLGLSEKVSRAHDHAHPKMFYLVTTSIKYTHPARPGDVLRLWSASDKSLSGLHRFNVEAKVGKKLIACGVLTLALVDESVTLPRALT